MSPEQIVIQFLQNISEENEKTKLSLWLALGEMLAKDNFETFVQVYTNCIYENITNQTEEIKHLSMATTAVFQNVQRLIISTDMIEKYSDTDLGGRVNLFNKETTEEYDN